jgi:hypothetical protein
MFDLKSTRSPLEWHESEAWFWQGVGPLTKVIHSDGVLSSLGAEVLRLSLEGILRAPSKSSISRQKNNRPAVGSD